MIIQNEHDRELLRRRVLDRYSKQWEEYRKNPPPPSPTASRPPPRVVVDIEQEQPTLLEMAENFATASAKWLSAGRPHVSQEEFEMTLKVCEACVDSKGNHIFDKEAYAGRGKCRLCGCNGGHSADSMVAKLAWATSQCGLSRWVMRGGKRVANLELFPQLDKIINQQEKVS